MAWCCCGSKEAELEKALLEEEKIARSGHASCSSAGLSSDEQRLKREAQVSALVPTAQPALPVERDVQTKPLTFTLNGEAVTVDSPDPSMSLAEWLRYERGLTGTKVSCNEGGCGACTVMMLKSSADRNAYFCPINACLRPLCSLQNATIMTIEGVGSKDNGYSDVQTALAKANGSQCGFCSVGMVMSITAALSEDVSPEEMESRLDGNICRCTGYRPILDTAQGLVSTPDIEDLCSGLRKCSGQAACPSNPVTACGQRSGCERRCGQQPSNDCCATRDATVRFKGKAADSSVWVKPSTLADLYSEMSSASDYLLVDGNTFLKGVMKYYNGEVAGTAPPAPEPGTYLDISGVQELKTTTILKTCVEFGGGVPLADVITTLENAQASSCTFMPIVRHLKVVANHQVRSVGSIAGNIMMALKYPEFASDVYTICSAASATLGIGDPRTGQVKQIQLTAATWNDVDGKVITSVRLPFKNASGERFKTFKIRLRKQNAHAIVNAAFYAELDTMGQFSDTLLVYGGVRPGLCIARETQRSLQGQSSTSDAVLQAALATLATEVVAEDGDRDAAYKSQLVASLFYKFMLGIQPSIPPSLQSAATDYIRPISSGTWDYTGAEDESEFPISQPMPNVGALQQTSGEAIYTDDVPLLESELHAAFVLSTVAGCESFALDKESALTNPGVVGVIVASDLSAQGYKNKVGSDKILAEGTIDYQGQHLAIVVAETQAIANRVAKQMLVSYTGVVANPVVSIDDAVAQSSFYGRATNKKVGDAETALASADVVVSGTVACGHQYHFHMETQTAIAYPSTSEPMKVFAATQDPSSVQRTIVSTLGLKQKDVKVQVHRLGGGYGGKLTNSIAPATTVAVVASILGRPVRLVVDLQANMKSFGRRIPYRFDYKAGAKSDGTIVAVTGTIYSDQGKNAGSYGGSVLAPSIDNAYKIDNWDLTGYACKTDSPPNTACRSPTFLPGTFLIESVVDHLAYGLNMRQEDVREKNLYSVNDKSFGGQTLKYCHQREAWDDVKESSAFAARLQAVKEFNAKNKYMKRGISLAPQKYGIDSATGLPVRVVVNQDGSVLIEQGGIECGQGLQTKVTQVRPAHLLVLLWKSLTSVTLVGSRAGPWRLRLELDLCATDRYGCLNTRNRRKLDLGGCLRKYQDCL
eukprot:scaffold3319_cov427-Prasinococcus_capsulatus_cf.AAC.17